MASNLPLIVFFVLFSLCVTSVYSLSTGDAVSKQDDESYLMATSDQGSSMIDTEYLAKARSLQALFAESKVAVIKKSKSSSSKSSKKSKKHKSKKVGSLEVAAFIGIIIAVIVVIIVILSVLYFFYRKQKTKEAYEKNKGSSDTESSKTEDHV